MNYWKKEDIEIYNGDFLNIPISEESIDLVITSPPYNVGINYKDNNDSISYKDYLNWTERWLYKVLKILKEDGRFCLNIPLDKNKGGKNSVYADIVSIAKNLGFNYQSTIVWNEQNISRRTAWGSWLSASAPYVIAPVEMIVLLYKKEWKKKKKGVSDITKEEFIEWTNGLWTFSGESRKRIGHPAPYPLELPKRCIKLFSYIGDTILDPFVGSGTTLISAYNLNRKAIGVEISKDYFYLAINRIKRECFGTRRLIK